VCRHLLAHGNPHANCGPIVRDGVLLALLLSVVPRPPRAPLFPYTTLFRSRALLPQRGVQPQHRIIHSVGAGGDLARGAHHATSSDRKSTRLNSSHDQISYAVLCLKKKSIRTTSTTPPTCRSGHPGRRPQAS